MKTSIYSLFALLLILCFGWSAAHAGCPKCPKPTKPTKFIECEKTYIQPSQIELGQEQIMVSCNGQNYEISALYKDEGGLYFKDYRDQGRCADGYWECTVCHDCTENYYIWCRTCYN